jgi:hypothetical protein
MDNIIYFVPQLAVAKTFSTNTTMPCNKKMKGKYKGSKKSAKKGAKR